MAEEKEFVRFSLNQRIQHIGLLITFSALVITGFPLSFPNTWWAQLIVSLVGGWDMRTQIHHVAGVSMVILGIIHILDIALKQRGKDRKPLKMMPRIDDLKEVIGYMKHLFGFAEEPKYDRYTWKEKFEYIGVVWGTLVMGLTGFMLLFPFFFMDYVPTAWIHLASVVHFWEALVATLVILIWHFYNVHFHPSWPMQKTWLTGKITEEQIKGHHRQEYEDLIEAEAEKDAQPDN